MSDRRGGTHKRGQKVHEIYIPLFISLLRQYKYSSTLDRPLARFTNSRVDARRVTLSASHIIINFKRIPDLPRRLLFI
jgi:hypothetical protein